MPTLVRILAFMLRTNGETLKDLGQCVYVCVRLCVCDESSCMI